MSYQAYNIARLHARDLFFLTASVKEKILRMGQKKTIIFCNSYPKSGTHLLYQILYSIPGFNKWNDIVSVQSLCGIINTPSHILWKISSAPHKSIVRCHLMYCNEILDIFNNFDYKSIFIYRDLRDTAVSHARWTTKEERYFLNNLYVNSYDEFDQQLMSSIQGVPLGTPFGSNISQPNIGQDFSRWKGWINDTNTLAIKFEELVGERGGGCEEVRQQRIQQIFEYLGIPYSDEQVKTKFSSSAMSPNESHTFLKGGKGSIGGWKSKFKDCHKQEFKKLAGNLLIELGYEKDLNW